MRRARRATRRSEADPVFEEQFASLPVHPPRTEKLPGLRFRATLSGSSVALPLALIVFFAALPLLILSTDERMLLEFRGRIATGRLVSAADAPGCQGAGSRRIVYSFTPEPGPEFRGAAVVCRSSPYYGLQPDEAVPIRYLPGKPQVNAPADAQGNTPPLLLFMIFPLFFFFVLFWPIYGPTLRELLRARRRYRNGNLGSGRIVFVKKRSTVSWPGWPGTSNAVVFVAYKTPSGESREATAWCANEWLLGHMSPGESVHIAYLDSEPGRVTILENYIR